MKALFILLVTFHLSLATVLYGQRTRISSPTQNPPYDPALPQMALQSATGQTGDMQDWGPTVTSTIATGDGHTTVFTPTLGSIPVLRTSINITVAGLNSTINDDGFGLLFGPGLTSGTVNYTNGAVSLTFTKAPANGAAITATYGQVSVWVDAAGLLHGATAIGTVTSVSCGPLSPLFTCAVATPTTTPAISFTLANAPAGTLYGNSSNSPTVPGFLPNPSLGVPGVQAGSIATANLAVAAYTIWGSNATSTNSILGPATTPVNGHLLDCTSFGAACTLHDSGIATASIGFVGNGSQFNPAYYNGAGTTMSVIGDPGFLLSPVTGTTLPAPSGTGPGLSVTGDSHSSDIQDWFLSGGGKGAWVDNLGVGHFTSVDSGAGTGIGCVSYFDATTNFVNLCGASSITTYTATLPAAQGTGALTNDGAGNLTWTSGGGGVTSVSGTANQIASTGGTTPILSITSPVILPGAATVNGPITFNGSGSGSAAIGVTANTSTPNQLNLPVETAGQGQSITSDGGSPQQLNWVSTNTPGAAPGDTIVDVGFGGGNVFQDENSGTSTSTINVGQTVSWKWVNGLHTVVSLSAHCGSNPCSGLEDGRFDSGQSNSTVGHLFSYTFTQVGTYNYYCDVHGFSMQGVVNVVGTNLESNDLRIQVANSGSPGTVLNQLAKVSSNVASVLTTSASDQVAATGCVLSGAGTTGNAQIGVFGQFTCLFDNTATTANDFVVPSATTAGTLHDAGSTFPTTGEVLGTVQTSNSACGSPPCGPYTVLFMTPDVAAAGAKIPGGGKGTTVQANGTTTQPIANLNSTTPAAGSNNLNVTLQSSNSGNTTSVSAEVPYSTTGSLPGLTIPNATPTNGNCTTWSVVATIIKLGDTGSPCGGSPGGGIIGWSATGLTLTAGTRYTPVVGGGTPSTTETDVDTEAPSAATVTNLYVSVSTTLGAGTTVAVTVRDNAADTSLTCNFNSATLTTCHDTSHSFNTVAGDLLTYKVITTGTIVATPTVIITAQFGTTGSSGTVNTGTSGQIGYYAAGGTAVSGAGPGTAGQLTVSNGTSGPQFLDYSDVHIIPFAASPAGTAASGVSYASGQWTAQNRTGSNNIGAALQAIPSTGAILQFDFELPNDWDTANQPYINIFYASGSNTSGTVIWTVASACSKSDGSVTDDPAFNAESAFGSQTMAAANRYWSKSGIFTAVTSGNNCIPGGTVIFKVALSGTAGSNINAYKAVVTVPRLIKALAAN